MNSRLLRKSLRTQKGVATVELAIVLPLFGILLLGVLEVGGMARDHQALQNGAREGARFSALPANKINGGAPAAQATIKNRVIAYMANERITVVAADITVDQAFPITIGAVTANASKVTITYTRPILFPGISHWFSLGTTLKGTAVFRNFY